MNVLLGTLRNSASSITTVVPEAAGQSEGEINGENAVPGNLLFLSPPFFHNCGVIATKKETEKGKGLVAVHLQLFRLDGRPPFHTPQDSRGHMWETATLRRVLA